MDKKRAKYKSFHFNAKRFGIEAEDSYEYVKLPFENSGKVKVLFVLDHVPSEDLHSGFLLKGVTGDLLDSMIGVAKRTYANQSASFSWLACTYNAFRTYGKSADFRAQADIAFTERLNALIVEYQPDYVVAFGTAPMRALLKDKIVTDYRGRTRYSYWLGVPVERTVKFKDDSHTTKVVSNISLNDISNGDSGEASLLGYMCKCLSPIFGKTYAVDSTKILCRGAFVVDTMGKFNKLMDKLAEQEFIAVDTETKNLNKVTNRLLTAQFAFSEERGFLVPISHKDSPFTPKEIVRIHSRLKAYFEGDNDNKYHIYTNAKFDLTVFREACGIRYFKNSIWDILGADFAMDENLKALDLALGEYYYSLGNMSVQYGFEGYLNAEFGKQHRADFGSADLTNQSVIDYTCYDVCVPIAIHNVQKRLAKDTGYTHHSEVVLNEISDTIHAFSKMEHTGAGLDVGYLFFLRTENSPIELEIKKMYTALISTPAAKKANKLLSDRAGTPTTSMFGEAFTAATVLKMSKPAHRKTLFFDVLKLKPLDKGKSGEGKLDKKFQEHYAHIPEVAQYTLLEKAKKLKTAFVNSFIQLLGESEDLQKDHRIRPDFGYLTVVTHRGSARNPNLQQVPARTELGKNIKRLFVAREGCLYVKVDYRVHEVRGWGQISFDKAVAKVFAVAKALRDEFRAHPTKELGKRLKAEADVHIQNASYFFGVKLEDVDKPLRNAVKGVIFGLIYQMSIKSLAVSIKRELEATKALVVKFQKRFPSGMGWIEKTKEFARKHWYVEAPTHIRRHLWGYMLPDSMEQANSIKARLDRQAVNSPIQGMCSKMMMSGIRILDYLIFKEIVKSETFKLFITNSVHDSLENEAGYANLLKSLDMIEWALTDGVAKVVNKRYGFSLVSTPEIDFEIGASLSHCDSWDFSVHQLERLVVDSLLFQRNKLNYKVSVDKVHDIIFSERALTEDAPKWMKNQIENIGYEFTLTEKEYIREVLNEGKASVAAGEAMLAEAGEDKDALKKANGVIAGGRDAIEYAKELNNYRHKHANS